MFNTHNCLYTCMHVGTSYKFSSANFLQIPLDGEKCENYTPIKIPAIQCTHIYVPVVARVVIHPQALHCTSALSVPSRRMSGVRAPTLTMVCLFAASGGQRSGTEREEGRRGGRLFNNYQLAPTLLTIRQIRANRVGFESFKCKFEAFESNSNVNLNHSNANSSHLNKIRSIRMQIWRTQMKIRVIQIGFKAFKCKFELLVSKFEPFEGISTIPLQIWTTPMRNPNIQTGFKAFYCKFEPLQCEFQPFERDSKHSNANLNHSRSNSSLSKGIQTNPLQIWTTPMRNPKIRTRFEAFECKFELL